MNLIISSTPPPSPSLHHRRRLIAATLLFQQPWSSDRNLYCFTTISTLLICTWELNVLSTITCSACVEVNVDRRESDASFPEKWSDGGGVWQLDLKKKVIWPSDPSYFGVRREIDSITSTLSMKLFIHCWYTLNWKITSAGYWIWSEKANDTSGILLTMN